MCGKNGTHRVCCAVHGLRSCTQIAPAPAPEIPGCAVHGLRSCTQIAPAPASTIPGCAVHGLRSCTQTAPAPASTIPGCAVHGLRSCTQTAAGCAEFSLHGKKLRPFYAFRIYPRRRLPQNADGTGLAHARRWRFVVCAPGPFFPPLPHRRTETVSDMNQPNQPTT